MDKKLCGRCRGLKPVSEFYRNKRYKSGYASYCKLCQHEANRAAYLRHPETYAAARDKWRAANPDGWFRHTIKSRYGITPEIYEAMLAAQDGKCAICGMKETGHNHQKRLHVDHDAETGKIRALLCGFCNKGLGQFRHSEALLIKAIAYLSSF